MRHEDRAYLRRALIAGHEDTYYKNAEFHSAIHALADLLPSWVDGLAMTADENAEDARAVLTGLLSRQPLANDIPPNRTE